MERRRRTLGRRAGGGRPATILVGAAASIALLSASGGQQILGFARVAGTSASRSPVPATGARSPPRGERASRHAVEEAGVKEADILDLDEAWMDVWDQTTEDLALDLRELLISDGNLYFVGPDLETHSESIKEVARLLNYTYMPWEFQNLEETTQFGMAGRLEHVVSVPPLLNIQRWPWSIMQTGLVIWIDADGHRHWDLEEKTRVFKLKFPKKRPAFGPDRVPDLFDPNDQPPPHDPIDMWNSADVHVDIVRNMEKVGGNMTNLILASTINAMLENPPKWREWFKSAKARGTIPNNYQTPFEARRAIHSHGISPRLNRILTA